MYKQGAQAEQQYSAKNLALNEIAKALSFSGTLSKTG
jgi:hypothetical protein